MSEKARLHRSLAVLCTVGVVHVVLALVFLQTSTLWFAKMLDKPGMWAGLAVGWLALQLALIWGALRVRTALRVAQTGTTGRARGVALAAGIALHTVASTATLGIVLAAAKSSIGHVLGGTIQSLIFGLTHLSGQSFETDWISPAFNTAAFLQAISSIWIVAAVVACWFLVDPRTRNRFWVLFDVALGAAFIGVMIYIALASFSPGELPLPVAVARLGIVAVAVVRASLRALAPTLGSIERMGFRSFVAARHLRAHKTRFLAASGTLSIMAVAVSSCMLVTVLSVMGGFRDDLQRKILGNHAHIVIDAQDDHFKPWRTAVGTVQTTPGVVAAAPFVQGEVMLSSVANQAGVVLRGIDPDAVGDVTDLRKNLTHGKLSHLTHPEQLLEPPTHGTLRDFPEDVDPNAGGIVRDVDNLLVDPTGSPAPRNVTGLGAATESENENEDVLPAIIVGQELARGLRLVVGDKVTVVTPRGQLGPTGPVPKSRPFRVGGIFYSGMYEYDMKYAYTALDVGQRFLNAKDAISGIEVKVADLAQAPGFAKTLATGLDRSDLRVRDWQSLNQHLFGALALEKLAMFVTLGIAILIAGFSVFGTLTLLVQEKRKEVGILKAMGTSARAVVRIFMLEGLLIGVAGAALGLGLGFLLIFAAEHFGIKMNPEVYYIDKLPVHLDPAEFSAVGAATVLVCLAATVFPAYQASRVRPVDALRYD